MSFYYIFCKQKYIFSFKVGNPPFLRESPPPPHPLSRYPLSKANYKSYLTPPPPFLKAIQIGVYLMMMLDCKGGMGVKNLGKSGYVKSESS